VNLFGESQPALARLLDRALGHGFRLVVAELRTPAERAELVAWLKERAPDVRELDARGAFADNPLAALEQVNPPLTERTVVVVSGLETTERGAEGPRAGALQSLNVQRDTLVARHPCFWILALHPSLRAQAQAIAPDFLDFASLWLDAAPQGEASPMPMAPHRFEGRTAAWSPVPWAGIPASARALLDAAWEHAGRWERDTVLDLLARVRLAHGHDTRVMACVALVEAWLDILTEPAQALAERFQALAKDPNLAGPVQAVAWVGRAKACLRAGNLEGAAAAVAAAQALGDRLWWLEALAVETEVLVTRGELDVALHLAREVLLPGWAAERAEREVAIVQDHVASILLLQGEYAQAQELIEQEVLPAQRRLGDIMGLAQSHLHMALLLERRGALQQAARVVEEQVLPNLDPIEHSGKRAYALRVLAPLTERFGHREAALTVLREQVIPLYERVGDTVGLAYTMLEIARMHLRDGHLDEAKSRTDSASALLTGVGHTAALADAQALRADLADTQGAHGDALRLREQVVEAMSRMGGARDLALAQGRLADTLDACGQTARALELRTRMVLPTWERLGEPGQAHAVALKMARSLVRLHRPNEALQLLDNRLLPAYHAAGNEPALARAQFVAAVARANRNRGADRKHAARLLDAAIRVFERHRLPELEQARRLRRELG
jgi:tetratricopeptide (TPR) repeat protein